MSRGIRSGSDTRHSRNFLRASRNVIYCEIPSVRAVGWADVGRVLRRLRTLRRAAPANVPPRLRLLRPFVLPATNALFCAFNDWQMRRLVAREPVLRAGVSLLFNFSVARTALQLIACVPHRRLVFDCTDDFSAVRGVPGFLAADEKQLLQQADLTLAPGRRFLEHRRAPLARRCVRLPHGALVERFFLPPKPAPADGRLTLLYYGHLHRQHLDFTLLHAIADARPRWRIILVGPVVTPHAFPPNVELPASSRTKGCAISRRRLMCSCCPMCSTAPYDDGRDAGQDFTNASATGRLRWLTPLPELRGGIVRPIEFRPRGGGLGAGGGAGGCHRHAGGAATARGRGPRQFVGSAL